MEIGILGAGNVGGALGRAWAGNGHQVTFGVADGSLSRAQETAARIGEGTKAALIRDAARADVVALAVPWDAARGVLESAGDLTGKVLLDCTNPLRGNKFATPDAASTSGGEQIAQWAPGARVVKVFNTLGFEGMQDPDFGGEAATMLYAGDDAEAKAIAATLAREMGFDAVDAGPLASAALLETLASLWGQLAYAQGMGRGIAFRLLKR
ncbi:NADPH-dependent F420 reductase [Capsulimonas corticalis]|uniref:NADPH-dependent F420 reductase n=1 Tax=Capsulimonas corticalis TaxID=2219043 RepID=A0A402D0C5_9BACT|nr:NADPH-dependent F420 reductase [Capsulimonas corticalis]BDI33711.1 NADPH-dependent F420 reductase [Capsulimonas corticalis]